MCGRLVIHYLKYQINRSLSRRHNGFLTGQKYHHNSKVTDLTPQLGIKTKSHDAPIGSHRALLYFGNFVTLHYHQIRQEMVNAGLAGEFNLRKPFYLCAVGCLTSFS